MDSTHHGPAQVRQAWRVHEPGLAEGVGLSGKALTHWRKARHRGSHILSHPHLDTVVPVDTASSEQGTPANVPWFVLVCGYFTCDTCGIKRRDDTSPLSFAPPD